MDTEAVFEFCYDMLRDNRPQLRDVYVNGEYLAAADGFQMLCVPMSYIGIYNWQDLVGERHSAEYPELSHDFPCRWPCADATISNKPYPGLDEIVKSPVLDSQAVSVWMLWSQALQALRTPQEGFNIPVMPLDAGIVQPLFIVNVLARLSVFTLAEAIEIQALQSGAVRLCAGGCEYYAMTVASAAQAEAFHAARMDV